MPISPINPNRQHSAQWSATGRTAPACPEPNNSAREAIVEERALEKKLNKIFKNQDVAALPGRAGRVERARRFVRLNNFNFDRFEGAELPRRMTANHLSPLVPAFGPATLALASRMDNEGLKAAFNVLGAFITVVPWMSVAAKKSHLLNVGQSLEERAAELEAAIHPPMSLSEMEHRLGLADHVRLRQNARVEVYGAGLLFNFVVSMYAAKFGEEGLSYLLGVGAINATGVLAGLGAAAYTGYAASNSNPAVLDYWHGDHGIVSLDADVRKNARAILDAQVEKSRVALGTGLFAGGLALLAVNMGAIFAARFVNEEERAGYRSDHGTPAFISLLFGTYLTIRASQVLFEAVIATGHGAVSGIAAGRRRLAEAQDESFAAVSERTTQLRGVDVVAYQSDILQRLGTIEQRLQQLQAAHNAMPPGAFMPSHNPLPNFFTTCAALQRETARNVAELPSPQSREEVDPMAPPWTRAHAFSEAVSNQNRANEDRETEILRLADVKRRTGFLAGQIRSLYGGVAL